MSTLTVIQTKATDMRFCRQTSVYSEFTHQAWVEFSSVRCCSGHLMACMKVSTYISYVHIHLLLNAVCFTETTSKQYPPLMHNGVFAADKLFFFPITNARFSSLPHKQFQTCKCLLLMSDMGVQFNIWSWVLHLCALAIVQGSGLLLRKSWWERISKYEHTLWILSKSTFSCFFCLFFFFMGTVHDSREKWLTAPKQMNWKCIDIKWTVSIKLFSTLWQFRTFKLKRKAFFNAKLILKEFSSIFKK